ncbi:MAG: hypothetical protein CMH53_05335 [Myxococcales bacterium]|nr:hypothetical protein [Myxococcales bacterium]
MSKILKAMEEAQRLHACVADGELVRVGGVEVAVTGWVMVRHDAPRYRIRSTGLKSTYPPGTEFGPFDLISKKETFAHVAFAHTAKGKGKEQVPGQNKWRAAGTGKSGGNASYTQYCDSFKKHFESLGKRSSEGAGGGEGGGAAKKSKIADFDVAGGLDGALGLAPGASGAVFDDGAGDSLLGVADTSLDFDAGAADDLLAGFDLDEIDAMNLAEIFPGSAAESE